ncbi:MAG: DUF3576 domain-containing protein [Alphaproteobacteria bacterium]|jgi:hypothetical protein|nr:DUF3576 domain-containing protein [Alphaproteobacteria bacterium]
MTSHPANPSALRRRRTWALIGLASFALTACGILTPTPVAPEPEPEGGLLFGPEGVQLDNILGGGGAGGGGGGIGVNSYLWRASLDTLSFMPLASADPFGGVIITDWFAPPEAGGQERFKLTVFILDQNLRADGIKVSVFRQERQGAGEWLDAVSNAATAVDLENAILTRARQMWLDAGAGAAP